MIAIGNSIGLGSALHAAVTSGLFAALSGPPRTAEEHATALRLDARATVGVLDVLVAAGMAERKDDRYGASSELITFLERSPGGLMNILALWGHVPDFLRAGTPYLRMDDSREASYANVVGALGRMFAPCAATLASKLSRAPSSVLDIGCGSGVWSLAIGERFPSAKLTGLDLPAVLAAFRARAAEQGMADRITTIEGDVHTVDIPRMFDLVVIANVLRIESPERAQMIVRRAVAALVPGGELLIVDALGGGTPEREIARTVYGLHLMMRTQQGRVYTPAEITAWMHGERIGNVELIQFDEHPAVPAAALLGRAPA